MGISGITSVFDRYLIVGFFLPSFFWLSYLKLFAGAELIPSQVEPDTATAFGIIGVVALIVGLLLQGVRVPVIRIYSGWYAMALWRDSRYRIFRWLGGTVIKPALRWKMLREYRRLAALAEKADPNVPRGPNGRTRRKTPTPRDVTTSTSSSGASRVARVGFCRRSSVTTYGHGRTTPGGGGRSKRS